MTDDRGPDPCMCGTPYPCRADHTPDPEWRAAASRRAIDQAKADVAAAVRRVKTEGGRL
jgi:hypothetical protein